LPSCKRFETLLAPAFKTAMASCCQIELHEKPGLLWTFLCRLQ
jgi:hypothetical protein